MRLDDLATLRADQDGVLSRQQLLTGGAAVHDIERWIRRRELVRLHPGVYLDHTGPPSWSQRAWAAVLLHPPAALDGPSALRAWGVRTGGSGDADGLDVVVSHGRRVSDPPGVTTRVSRTFHDDALPHLRPPRIRLEAAVLDVAAAQRRPDGTVAVLADAVQSRRTTAERLRTALLARPRLPGRALLTEVLTDVDAGALSAMERRYLRDVERTHGLPRGERQGRSPEGRAADSDVRYRRFGVRVELDGVLGHSHAQDRWADLERDLVAAASGEVTLRPGWRQVLAPCRLAAVVGSVLNSRGWSGMAGCRTCDRGGSSARGAVEPPRSA